MYKNGAKLLNAQYPEILSLDTAINDGVTIDRSWEGGGLGPLMFTAISGAITAGVVAAELEDSDDGTTWAAVAPELYTTIETFGVADDDKMSDVLYLGTKRYVRANRATSGFSGGFAVAAVVAPPDTNLGLIELSQVLPLRPGQSGTTSSDAKGGSDLDTLSLALLVGATAGTGTTAMGSWLTGDMPASLSATIDAEWYDGIAVDTFLDITAAMDQEVVRCEANTGAASYVFMAYGTGGPTTPSVMVLLGGRLHGQVSNAVRNTL